MKILLAPDKFKGSLSAQNVCAALERGLKKSAPSAEIISRPLADGGDGSIAILEHYLDLQTMTKTVQDPLLRPIHASYSMAQDVAYIEMAMASGLVLLQPTERNCMYTTSYGTGELMADAIERGAKEIYLFIGGSATNDGGIGIAHALGYQFYTATGNLVSPKGKNLLRIEKIDNSQVLPGLKDVSIKVVCDVDNPFHGKQGAAHVYAAQKGASLQEIIWLDQGLSHLAVCLLAHGYPDIGEVPGAGAAGGVGGGCMAFLGAELVSGIQTFLALSQLEQVLKDCDLVITGEGKLDAQTEHGKVVSGVCQLAQKYGIPVIAVCGIAEENLKEKLQLQDIYTVMSRSGSMEEAMSTAEEKLEDIGAEILG